MLRTRRAAHEHDTVVIDRGPVVPVDLEGKPLLTVLRVHHDRSPVTHEFDDASPPLLPHPSGDVPDANPGAHFQQPPGQVSAQPRWNGSEPEHSHSSPP